MITGHFALCCPNDTKLTYNPPPRYVSNDGRKPETPGKAYADTQTRGERTSSLQVARDWNPGPNHWRCNGINQYVELLKGISHFLEEGDSIPAYARSSPQDPRMIQSLISTLMGGFRTLSARPQRKVPSFLTRGALGNERLSAFLYNISLYLQSNNPQDPAAESLTLNTMDSEEVEMGSPPRATLELKDIFISLRASQNQESLIELLQSILDLFTNPQLLRWILQKENWEVLVGLIETLSQTLFSGTFAQAKGSIEELLCPLTRQRGCSTGVDWFESLGKLLNWKSVVNLQPNGPQAQNERFQPWNEPGESGGGRTPVENVDPVQSLLQILSKPSGRRSSSEGPSSVNRSENAWGEDTLWGGLQELRQNILRKVRTSVYTNFKRKISRMTKSLVNEVSSVIGIPQSDQNGKCSAGNLRQLLLWGIKNNITWDVGVLGSGWREIGKEPPFVPCPQRDKVQEAARKPRHVPPRWEEEEEEASLEAVCNDSSPGLPGISNFTVHLYCNLINRSAGSDKTPADLRASCSDAAWYFSAAPGDLYWARLCRRFYPDEMASSLCSEESLGSARRLGRAWVAPLCSGLPRGPRSTNISTGPCHLLGPGRCGEALRILCSNQQEAVAELCSLLHGPDPSGQPLSASFDPLCSRVKRAGGNGTLLRWLCAWRRPGGTCQRLLERWSALGSAGDCVSDHLRQLCTDGTAQGPWANQLCALVARAPERESGGAGPCLGLLASSNVTASDLQQCLLAPVRDLCTHTSSRRLADLCQQLLPAAESPPCDYNSWSLDMFVDGELVEQCRERDAAALKEVLCRNTTVYQWVSRDHPGLVQDCAPAGGDCLAQRLVDLLPEPLSVNTSQLCQDPAAFLKDLVDQFYPCDDPAFSWLSGASSILRVFQRLQGPSGLEHADQEVQEVLSQAILLSSLLDNSSFWVTFNPNASAGILQTVDTYLKQETNADLKKDLLSCFSPVLWDMLQSENDFPALQVLFQEYLQMPQENFQKLLMSAEKDAVKKLLSYMHRMWHQLQVGVEQISQRDAPALETLAASFLHKFPQVTPELFVDLSQFIPFLTVPDILGLPASLLLNDSVLAAIQDHSPQMKVSQKKAFARRLVQGNTFGQVGTWSSDFLASVQTLLPYLPTSHFQHLTTQQLASVKELLRNSNLDPSRGRHVIRTMVNSSHTLTSQQVEGRSHVKVETPPPFLASTAHPSELLMPQMQILAPDVSNNAGQLCPLYERLGRLICFASQEDLRLFLAAQPKADAISSTLLECIKEGTIDAGSGVAHLLASHLWGQNLTSLTHQDLLALGQILPVLGVNFLKNLSAQQRLTVVSGLDSKSLTTAQADQLVTEMIQDINVTMDVLCRLAHLLPGFSPSALGYLPAQALAGACSCFSPFLALLSSTQKAVILDVLQVQGNDDGSQLARFGCLIPYVPLKVLAFEPETFLRNRGLFGDWAWSQHQVQFIFKKLQQVSNVTNDSFLLGLGCPVPNADWVGYAKVLVLIGSLGNVARGVDCKVLHQRAMEPEFLAMVGSLSGLHGGIRPSLRKCIIKELSRWPEKFQNNILLMGPEIMAELPLKILNHLPNDSVRTTLNHLTRHTLHLLTLLPHKRSYLAERALQLLGVGTEDEISGEIMDSLGPLLAFIEEEKIKQIDQADLLLHLDEVKGYCIPEQNQKSFGWMLTKEDVLGAASRWNLSQVEYVDRLVLTLAPEDIHQLSKEVLTPESVELVLHSEERWGLSKVGRICRRQQSRRARTTLLSKRQILAGHAIKSIVARRRDDSPRCIDIKATFPAAWSSSQLGSMADTEFATCLEVLTGDPDLSIEQKKVLVSKAKHVRPSGPGSGVAPTWPAVQGQSAFHWWLCPLLTATIRKEVLEPEDEHSAATRIVCTSWKTTWLQGEKGAAWIRTGLYGPVMSMKRWQVMQLGRAASQLNDRDLQSLDLLDLGILSFLGEMEEWSMKQRKAVLDRFLRQARRQVTELDATTLVALGHFICGMSVSEIERIRPEELSKAVLFIGELKLRCSEDQLEALARLSTHSEAFGPVSKWGAEIFTETGSIAAGLADMDLSALIEEQIEGLTPSAISLLLPDKFAVVFSADQLSYFTNVQASAVTMGQYEKLSLEQRRALSAAQYDGELHQEQRGKNTAASFKLFVPYLGLSVTYSLGAG
ncbi:stereocilin [Narcine bancroftii]|uniref:stereocilin n=1 Tax=Narcine bancroftii TaxID=1343680 RepID=UPI0038316662